MNKNFCKFKPSSILVEKKRTFELKIFLLMWSDGQYLHGFLASFVYSFSKEGQEKSQDQLQAHANFFFKITKILLLTFFK